MLCGDSALRQLKVCGLLQEAVNMLQKFQRDVKVSEEELHKEYAGKLAEQAAKYQGEKDELQR